MAQNPGTVTSISMVFESKDGNPNLVVPLQNKLFYYEEARQIKVRLLRASVWNTVPNILSGSNVLTINESGQPSFQLVIDEGSYSIDQLAAAVSRFLVTAGKSPTLLVLTADEPTQKVLFTTDSAGLTITVDGLTPASLLGLNPGTFVLTDAGVSYPADNRAGFNTINRFQITSNLAGQGVQTNGQYNGVLANIPITATSGFQNNYAPTVPLTVDATGIRGTTFQSVTANLVDENLLPIYTSEPWSFEVEISFIF